MPTCLVKSCKNRTSNTKLPFFKLPSDESSKQAWLNALSINQEVPMKDARICIDHFKESDILQGRSTSGNVTLFLTVDAVPKDKTRESSGSTRTEMQDATVEDEESESCDTFEEKDFSLPVIGRCYSLTSTVVTDIYYTGDSSNRRFDHSYGKPAKLAPKPKKRKMAKQKKLAGKNDWICENSNNITDEGDDTTEETNSETDSLVEEETRSDLVDKKAVQLQLNSLIKLCEECTNRLKNSMENKNRHQEA